MARPRKYRINLTPKERNRIKQAKRRAKGIRKNTRYDIILAADENRYKEVPTYNEIAAKAGVTVQTVIETLKGAGLCALPESGKHIQGFQHRQGI